MKLYVLTCINEDLEIVNQEVFLNHGDAHGKMFDEFNRERSAMQSNEDEDYIVQDEFFYDNATLVYGEQPYQYEWKIREVEI